MSSSFDRVNAHLQTVTPRVSRAAAMELCGDLEQLVRRVRMTKETLGLQRLELDGFQVELSPYLILRLGLEEAVNSEQ